jgi:hypothetical protein
MAKINVRSPYFINVSASNLTSAQLEIYIYTGTASSSWGGSVTYSLTSTAYSAKVSFEISELVRDYLTTGFDGEYNTTNLYSTINVDYRITKSISGTAQTPDTAVLGIIAYDGYGYFEDGVNPSLLEGLLISNTTILKPDDAPLRIPVDPNNTTSVSFFYKGKEIYTDLVADVTDSKLRIEYITNESQAGADGYEDRVLEDGGIFEDSFCLESFLGEFGIYGVDEVFVSATEGVTKLRVTNIEECKYEPYKLVFVNKYGALQDLWMFKRSNLSINTTEETYKSNIVVDGIYNTYSHQKKILSKNATQKLVLNSGHYPEGNNLIFKELMLSEMVWIDYEGNNLPVHITSSNLGYKTNVNDKLIDYTIEVEFAFQTVNNIR